MDCYRLTIILTSVSTQIYNKISIRHIVSIFQPLQQFQQMGNQSIKCCGAKPRRNKDEDRATLKSVGQENQIEKVLKYLKREGDSFGYNHISDRQTGNTFLHQIMKRDDLNDQMCQFLLMVNSIEWNVKNKLRLTPLDMMSSPKLKQKMLSRVKNNPEEDKIDDDPLYGIDFDEKQATKQHKQQIFDSEDEIQCESPLKMKKVISIDGEHQQFKNYRDGLVKQKSTNNGQQEDAESEIPDLMLSTLKKQT